MKRTIVLAAAVALLAAVANGAVVQFHTLGTGSNDGNVSTGGDWVAGGLQNQALTGVAYRVPAYWQTDPNGGAAPVYVHNAVNVGKGAGYHCGIDQKGGSLFTSANSGSTVYTAANFIGRAGNPNMSVLLAHTGSGSSVNVGGNNSVAATSDGADAWIVGDHKSTADAEVWKWSNGTTALYHPVGTGTTDFRSVASNGNAVGQDRGGVGYTGATSATRAVYWTTAIGNGAPLAIPPFAGNGPTTQGQGFGVSDDGTKFVGLGWAAGNANAFGFVWTMGDANSVRLDRPLGWIGTPTVVYAYDVTNDGAVAGNAYMDDSAMWGGLAGNHDTGTIWFPGETVGHRAIDVLAANGVYDPLTRVIGRVYSIAQLPDGKYAISGEGSFFTNLALGTYETRGWYAVVPEPATLGLLALGLVLMRRRR